MARPNEGFGESFGLMVQQNMRHVGHNRRHPNELWNSIGEMELVL
jgi:hypothetical protein